MNARVRLAALMLLMGLSSGTALAQPAADPSTPPAADPGTGAIPPPPAAPPPAAPATAVSSLKLESASTTIKFGLLAQPQYEAVGSTAVDGMSQNLFLRRARILVGGTVFGVIDYFLDTDYPNLFKAATVGAPGASVKAAPGMNIQDAFVTAKPMGDVVKIDAGFMLPPLSHNALQGAGTLFGWDYFAFAFQHSNSFGASVPPVGRDLGVQARGLVLDGRLEYRAGLFQGLRNDPTATQVGSRNFFRAAARVQVNLFDAEPGFFYAGTYFGAKKVLSFGLSGDIQSGYRYFAIDGLADLPLGPGVLTAQVNVAHWNGGTFIPALVSQTALMAEVGYTVNSLFSPIIRFEELVLTGAAPNTTRVSLGGAYWPYLHTSNLKLFYTRVSTQAAPHGANQINLQWQVYFF